MAYNYQIYDNISHEISKPDNAYRFVLRHDA